MENTEFGATPCPNSTVSLPIDIYRLVVAEIEADDYQTLLSLCLSNRLLNYEGTKRLYRDFGSAPRYGSFHLKLLSTLLSRPDLAAMVRSYYLRDVSRTPKHTEETLYRLIGEEEEENMSSAQREFIGQLVSILFARALPLMVNLKVLAYGDRGKEAEACSLLSSAHLQLEKLDWRNRWDDTLITFLERQKSLRWLKLHPRGKDVMASISTHPIPTFASSQSLITLAGKQAVVEAILPFAPGVRNLALHFTDRRDTFSSIFHVARDLARCMGQLTRLTFHNHYTRISVAVLEGAVDNLEYLAVGCAVDDNVSVPFTPLKVGSRMAKCLLG